MTYNTKSKQLFDSIQSGAVFSTAQFIHRVMDCGSRFGFEEKAAEVEKTRRIRVYLELSPSIVGRLNVQLEEGSKKATVSSKSIINYAPDWSRLRNRVELPF